MAPAGAMMEGAVLPNGGTDTPIEITLNDINQSTLNNYTLENIGGIFLAEIEQEITSDTSIDKIVITISNSNYKDATVTVGVSNDDGWKTTPIKFTDLIDGENELTITVTYFDENDVIGTETTASLTITYDNTAPFIESSSVTSSNTEFNKDFLDQNNNEISYTFNFSEAISGLEIDDFEITPANNGVSIQPTTFNDGITTAAVTFSVSAGTDDDFSIALPNGSYTDNANNNNKETLTELPIAITVDNIAPTITNPAIDGYDVTTDTFTFSVDFSEAVVLTTNDIVLNNATIENITYENSGGTGKVVIEAKIISLSGIRPTITINGSAYSDTVGNTGSVIYELTIISEAQETEWLTAGSCQNFSFDDGSGTETDPYQISHICHLQNIDADDITIDGIAYENLLNKNYILVSGIDASYTAEWNSGAGFNPIGDNTSSTDRFNGIFDGGGFALSNLTVNREDANYTGLFGYTSSTSTIKDITLENVNITGDNYVGGLVDRNDR